jgi:DNA-binding beta-propeller fold protein YncE
VGDSNLIRKIEIATGVVTTLALRAGMGSDVANLISASDITTDGTNLYVIDISAIRKVVISTGEVTTIAGTALSAGSSDGIGVEASFRYPLGITTDGTSLYVADTGNNMIRRIQ